MWFGLNENTSTADWVMQMERVWQEQKEELESLLEEEAIFSFETNLTEIMELVLQEQEIEMEELNQSCQRLFHYWQALNDQAEENHRQMLRQYKMNNDRQVPIGGHRLPPLPYKFDALEPYISEEIMKLHYLKHHQSYVDGLNKAEKMLQEARNKGDYSLIKHWERELAFNGAGHYLHTIFWNNMSPYGGGEPSGALADAIRRDFGSFEKFKQQFGEAANKVEGSGWAILVWSPRSHRLEILQAEKHQNLSQWDVVPLLALDVWEHAYYLDYKNDRAKYINQWWNVVNWPDVEKRFSEAQKLRWQPY